MPEIITKAATQYAQVSRKIRSGSLSQMASSSTSVTSKISKNVVAFPQMLGGNGR